MLLPDGPEAGQLGGDVLADLDRGRDQHRAEAGGVVDEQLGPRVPPEDRVLHPASRGRDIEALAVPVEPVGAQVRAPVAADPGHHDVTRFGEERFELLGRCHARTLSGLSRQSSAPCPGRSPVRTAPGRGAREPAQGFRGDTRFRLLPGFAGPVEGGLRDAVEHAGPRPLARIRGQARQAEHGVGDVEAPAAAAAIRSASSKLDRAPSWSPSWRRTQPRLIATVSLLSPFAREAWAAASRWARAAGMSPTRSACTPALLCRIQANRWSPDRWVQAMASSNSSPDVPGRSGRCTSGSPTGPRRAGRHRPAAGPARRLPGRAAGRARPRRRSSRRSRAPPRVAMSSRPRPAGGPARPPVRRTAGRTLRRRRGSERGYDQGPAEQHRVRPGIGPLEHRREQGQGFPAPATRHPVTVQGHGQAQDLLGPARDAGRIPGRTPQVRLIGVQPGEPVALVRSPSDEGPPPRRRTGSAGCGPPRRRLPRPRPPRPGVPRRTRGSSPAAGSAGRRRLARP